VVRTEEDANHPVRKGPDTVIQIFARVLGRAATPERRSEFSDAFRGDDSTASRRVIRFVSMWSRAGLVASLSILAGACAPTAPAAGVRSPTLDYPQSEAQTSNGEVVGADQMAPEDKLDNGARVSPRGLIPSGGPPQPESHSPLPTPQQRLCTEIGLESKDGHCKAAPIPPEKPQ
jgi:hypothetical protein